MNNLAPANSSEASNASDDSALIRRAQAGDAGAFSLLVEKYYDTLYRFAYRWSGSRVDAEDITQQACIKLARSIVQFRFEAAFSSWLYRLVINCAKDWRKSQARHKGQELYQEQTLLQNNEGSLIEEGEPHIDQTAENSIYLQQILSLLDRMAEGFKETALLVYAEGLTHAEAANILQVKESTVSWRLHDIRKQLQLWQKNQDGSIQGEQGQGNSWEVPQ